MLRYPKFLIFHNYLNFFVYISPVKKYYSEDTDSTPLVSLDPNSGVLEFKGRSIPENASDFYLPIINWLEEYTKAPQPNTRLILYLEYINSISQKMIFDILRKAEDIKDAGSNVKVMWYYDEDDEEMQVEGEIFQSKFELDIILKEVEEEQDEYTAG